MGGADWVLHPAAHVGAVMARRQRRPQGTGTVFQRKSDGLWVARIDNGWDQHGNRKRPQRTSKTKAGAQLALKELQRQAATGNLPEVGSGARATVKSWADDWLIAHAREVRPNVLVTDTGHVTKWIVPASAGDGSPTSTPATSARSTSPSPAPDAQPPRHATSTAPSPRCSATPASTAMPSPRVRVRREGPTTRGVHPRPDPRRTRPRDPARHRRPPTPPAGCSASSTPCGRARRSDSPGTASTSARGP